MARTYARDTRGRFAAGAARAASKASKRSASNAKIPRGAGGRTNFNPVHPSKRYERSDPRGRDYMPNYRRDG